MFWLYLLLVTLSLLPAILTGVGAFRTGWEIWGVSQIVTPIVWALAAPTAIKLTLHMRPGAWKVFAHTLFVTLAFVGALFGQALGLISGLAFNYGASETELAIGFAQFFALGAAIAMAPSALVGGIAVLIVWAANLGSSMES